MLERLRKLLSKEQGHDSLVMPESEFAMFLLMYNDLPIGCLTANDGKWTFVYSDLFKQQDELAPLIDFPDTNKTYISEKLWPFFSIRIPSLAQPAVQQIIEEEDLDKNNTVGLLKRFGQHAIANPFELAVST